MFTNDRKQIRQFYFQSWQKHLKQQRLDGLEQQIVDVILAHPEYQPIFGHPEQYDDKDFFAELGESNPFLHLGLHLSIREQIATNRPVGIQSIHETLLKKMDTHDAEHLMIETLAEQLWQAQRKNVMPDESEYLENLRELLRAGSKSIESLQKPRKRPK